MTDTLAAAVDRVLIDGLPRGLKAAIDEALMGGATHDEITGRIWRQMGGREGLVYQGVCAYLRRAEDSLANGYADGGQTLKPTGENEPTARAGGGPENR